MFVPAEAVFAEIHAHHSEVVDRAMQLFGGMGMSKELPLEFISRVVRIYRVVEGPSEVHRWVVARDLLKNGLSL